MPVHLSIKNVPDDVAERLRRRAARAHRSLQGELMKILEDAVVDQPIASATEILARVRELGVETSAESSDMIRGDRDER